MKCSAYEQSIYLWKEISPEEIVAANRHMETCSTCSTLFKQVQVMQQRVTKVSAKKTTSPNAAQLTSRIMQAVHEQQNNSRATLTARLFSPFQLFRYACATLSLVLVISFALEYTVGTQQKTEVTTLEEGVILSSAMIRSSAVNRKKRKSIFSACKTPFTDQLAYKECIKQQFH